ncbi:unnamed protein product [Pleuronectes platessa]|uniref:Uncharacterized protein n=1 Tax=Pleuronectes platessa TaxID=8262 RepID=A0A9N7ZCC7_PLEPL|nr:unnamed protein product [Pleuronectes platessa]
MLPVLRKGKRELQFRNFVLPVGLCLTPGSHRTRKRRRSVALITAEVCDIISNARHLGVATASGVNSQAPARQGLALTPRFGVASASGYDFCLENWVLIGLQSGVTSHHHPQLSSSSSGLLPSCPPYWMMFSSTQQSCVANRHSSDFWEPNPQQRSNSLNADIMRTKFTISDSENEGESIAQNSKSSVSMTIHPNGAASRQRGHQKAFIADLLNPPACLSSLPHQRRKNPRQCSLSVLEMSSQLDRNEDNQAQSLFSDRILHTKTPNTIVSNSAVTIRCPNNRANTVQMLSSITNYRTMAQGPCVVSKTAK